VSNAYLSRIPTDKLYDETLTRAKKYKQDLAVLLESDPDYAKSAINIERHTLKDPKRFTTFLDVYSQIKFFFDEERENLHKSIKSKVESLSSQTERNPVKGNPWPEDLMTWWLYGLLPKSVTQDVVKVFVQEYVTVFNLEVTVEEWFAQLKEIWKKYGFAWNNAEFKEGGYICKIGDLAMFLRLQLCCSPQTPDLFSVMKVMGKERVIKRLKYLV